MEVNWDQYVCHMVEIEDWEQTYLVLGRDGRWEIIMWSCDGVEWPFDDKVFTSAKDAKLFLEEQFKKWSNTDEA